MNESKKIKKVMESTELGNISEDKTYNSLKADAIELTGRVWLKATSFYSGIDVVTDRIKKANDIKVLSDEINNFNKIIQNIKPVIIDAESTGKILLQEINNN
jgi:hypothetical protein